MRNRLLVATMVLSVVAAMLVAGCGGGGGGAASPPISGTARLTTSSIRNPDGSRRWVTHFRARRNGTVEIQMNQGGSQSLSDPFLMVFEGNYGASTIPPNAAVLASDNDSGVGYDALIDVYCNYDQIYTVWFTTVEPADYGTFLYSVDDSYGYPTAAVHEATEAGKTPVSPASKLK